MFILMGINLMDNQIKLQQRMKIQKIGNLKKFSQKSFIYRILGQVSNKYNHYQQRDFKKIKDKSKPQISQKIIQ